jgi:hypothetical protein
MKNFIKMRLEEPKVKLDEGEVLQFGRVLLKVILQTVYECCNRGLLRRNGWKILNRRYNKSEEDKISILKKCLLSSINAKKISMRTPHEISENSQFMSS